MMASGSLRRLITVTSASWITRSITDFSVLRASEKLITLISFLCVYNLEYKNIKSLRRFKLYSQRLMSYGRTRNRRTENRSARGQHGDSGGASIESLYSAFLLPQKALRRRELPDVPGGGGEDAKSCSGVCNAGRRRHGCAHKIGKAVAAQQAVMEFLLINHPLDCPICDQGGECQLQDLAVGYGKSHSRYTEAKRVVFHKNAGPLIAMEEMTRCIHCTRCVRFGKEIAGVMELGMLGRGEHAEITAFVGQTVDSELSGNMIDLCPVGALTSKPFRYTARGWELTRYRSISPHDSVGANLIIQVKNQRVMRVLPFENEAVNECWISDKDRFSYEALNSDARLARPMVKHNGAWREIDWETALSAAVEGLQRVRSESGADSIAALASPHSTLEALYLLKQLMRGIGSPHIDFRLRQSDVRAALEGAPWLGMPITALSNITGALIR